MSNKKNGASILREMTFEYFSASQAKDKGVHGQTIRNMVDAGELYKIDRGLYSFDENWDDELYIIQKRFSRGIYSHDTAMYLLGYSDRTPSRYDMTFPQGYNSKKLDEYDLNVRHVKAENYLIGITTLLSPMGNEIRVYNLERSLCDILRGSGSNVELINSAMRRYANSKNKNVPQLLQYAEQLRVRPKVMRYMEVLL